MSTDIDTSRYGLYFVKNTTNNYLDFTIKKY